MYVFFYYPLHYYLFFFSSRSFFGLTIGCTINSAIFKLLNEIFASRYVSISVIRKSVLIVIIFRTVWYSIVIFNFERRTVNSPQKPILSKHFALSDYFRVVVILLPETSADIVYPFGFPMHLIVTEYSYLYIDERICERNCAIFSPRLPFGSFFPEGPDYPSGW